MIGAIITLQGAGFLLTGASLVTLGAACAGPKVRLGLAFAAALSVAAGVLMVDATTRQLNLASIDAHSVAASYEVQP